MNGERLRGVRLSTPAGIVAALRPHDPSALEAPYSRFITELVAEIAEVPAGVVRVGRDGVGAFGHHRNLFATASGERLPYSITLVEVAGWAVGAVCGPEVSIGLDVRRADPLDEDLREMRRHSHLFPGTTTTQLLAHWTRVQAVRAADGRGARISPEHVLIDPPTMTGWAFDRRIHYHLVDLSVDDWTITLAHGANAPQTDHVAPRPGTR